MVVGNSNDINHWLDLCAKAEKAGDYAEVLRAGDQVVRLAPNAAAAHFIRGLALHKLDRIEEAIEVYRRVIALDPAYIDALTNLGECNHWLNRLPEAEGALHQAIVASDQVIAGDGAREIAENEYGAHHWNLALIELLRGDLANGFARYRVRFKALPGKKRPDFLRPLWRGEDLRDKTILVTVEQGYGDTLMMARFVPLLKERGARVLFQVQPALTPLFRGWSGADQILEWGRDALPDFDYHASEFDLPHRLGVTLATLPAKPYLPLLPADDATRLPETTERKIGVVWGGTTADPIGFRRWRSVPLAAFAPLLEAKDFRFYSLTQDMRDGEAELLKTLPVTDLAARISDFAATARFIGQMDLVITCDTSIAHLAGGMGKPVWILLQYAPDWRWLADREDSPWYPSARLFRQKARHDWNEVIARVNSELAKLKQ